MSDLVVQFERQSFLNLETFKRSGQGVKTPVWFAQEGPTLYVRTGAESGKVKRVRNNGRARVVPSDAQGQSAGRMGRRCGPAGGSGRGRARQPDGDAQVRRLEDRL